MSSPDISREVRSVALAICDGSASSIGDMVKTLITEKRWDELATLVVDPNSYSDSESYFNDVACVSFLKKYEPLPTSFDRKAVALTAFYEAERKCFRTNQRLLPFVYGTYSPLDEAVYDFIVLCRKEVFSLVGSGPPNTLIGRFGPGATYGDRGSLTTIPDKMQSRPLLTDSASPFLEPWLQTLWSKACMDRKQSVCFIRGNRFTTVPKDCEKDRGISIEPSINLFYQLALGSAIRSAIKKSTNHRLDLGQMQDIHRQVAREASISGRFATIDLKQASDTVSSALVKALMPRRWFNNLDALRSKTTSIQDGRKEKVIVLEKFSSMGNGYTFELETLLFLAICCAVLRKRGITPCPGQNVFVYGDDIIVPTDCATDVLSALRYFGLDQNPKKTFLTGPFRESCGGDYFMGVNVRPHFQKVEANEPQHYIAMANGIKRMVSTDHVARTRWPLFIRSWFRCLDFIPQHIKQCRGPQELGDLCINDEESAWTTRWKSGVRYIRVFKPHRHRKVKLGVFDPDVLLATACYGDHAVAR